MHARLRFALSGTVLGGALALTSCGGSTQAPIVAPSGGDAPWVTQMLGGPADFSVIVRPTTIRADTYWGPVTNRLIQDSERHEDPLERWLQQEVAGTREIDVYVTLRDPLRLKVGRKSDISARSIGWLAVFYGVPPMDPMNIRDRQGRGLFTAPYRLPSGVMMWSADPHYVNDLEGLAPTLFYTQDNAFIATDQVSAPHVSAVLAGTPNAPPPLTTAPDALAGLSMGVTSMQFVSAEKSDAASVTGGLKSGGIGLRGGSNGALEAFADYATSDDADRAYKAIQAQCAADSKECVFEPGFFKGVKAEKSDRRILVTMLFSDALLRSIQSYQP